MKTIRQFLLFCALLCGAAAFGQSGFSDIVVARTAKYTGAISPSQITTTQNDYAPTGIGTTAFVRVSTDASRDITGITTGAAGRFLWVVNVGSFNVVLKDEDNGSTAANRFALDGDLTLYPGATAALWYDIAAGSGTGRWISVSADGSSSSGVTSITGTANQITASAAVGPVTLSLAGPHNFTTLTTTAVLLGAGTSAIAASDMTYVTPVLTVPDAFSITSVGSVAITAGGSAKDITLRPSSGIVLGQMYGDHFIWLGQRANGSLGSETTLASGDRISSFQAFGYNGSGYVLGGSATFRTKEAWSVSNRGTGFDISVPIIGATSGLIRFSIEGNGSVRIGQNSMAGAAAWGTTGIVSASVGSVIYTDNSSSGTVASAVAHSWGLPQFAASSATVFTDYANIYVAGAPTQGTNVSGGNGWAVWIDSGNFRLDGSLYFSGITGPVLSDSSGAFSITGGTGNMTITSGTGNSRTLILRTTTSGGTATTFLTGNADQSTTLAGNLTFGTSASVLSGTTGSVGLSAIGTNQSITFTPSGSGGVLLGVNGTAANPAIAFSSTASEGFYKTSFSRMGYSHAGSPRVALGDSLYLGSATTLGFTTVSDPGSGTIDVEILRSGTNTLAFKTNSTTALTLGADQTAAFAGPVTVTPAARASGVASYFTVTTPTDTGITASTESIGNNHATGTRTWATTGTVALQREHFFAGPTYASASASQTFTDAFTVYMTPPVVGTNAIFTRGHTLGIVDSTSAASSITGGFVIATTLGTTATSVGIGAGKINAGADIMAGTYFTAGGSALLTGTGDISGSGWFQSGAPTGGTAAKHKIGAAVTGLTLTPLTTTGVEYEAADGTKLYLVTAVRP